MRTILRWLAGLAGVAGALGLLRRRHAPSPPGTPAEPAGSDPAVELRRKLDEARAQHGAPESPQPPPPEPKPVPAEVEMTAPAGAVPLEERRARLHAKAQEAIESMRTEA